MFTGLANRLIFIIERLLLGGAHFQLLVIAGLILLVSFSAGILVLLFAESFTSFSDASWWAFLRLSDPGYLGDDHGILLRFVSTIVTILGYVLFMGALIAIMTQWLNSTIRRFESGLTPITLKGHILVLGWTNRTKTIVKEIVAAQGRLRRFLDRIGAGRLRIVILSEMIEISMAHELREELGGFWKQRRIVLRSGTPLRIEDLRRVNFTHAGVIILPGTDFSSGGSSQMDTNTVKSLLSITKYGHSEKGARLPLVAAELFDARKLPVAKSAYQGDIELIPSDTIISRLIAQNVRHRGLSFIYTELLSHREGNQIYIRELPQLEGILLQEMNCLFPRAALMGVLRATPEGWKPFLNPPQGLAAEKGDRFVFLSETYNDTLPGLSCVQRPVERCNTHENVVSHPKRKLLILGWNRKVPVLLNEFGSYRNESFDIDILSLMTVSDRQELMDRYGNAADTTRINHLYGDYTAVNDLQDVQPDSYDNILLLSSDRLESGEESDARTILGYILLRDIFSDDLKQPEIIIELMDPDNDKLFEKRTGEVLVSPLILSHILAHVALRPDLNAVFDELFTNGGAELYLRQAGVYGIAPGEYNFAQIQEMVVKSGDTALGIRKQKVLQNTHGGIELNPDRNKAFYIDEEDEIVVLTTYS